MFSVFLLHKGCEKKKINSRRAKLHSQSLKLDHSIQSNSFKGLFFFFFGCEPSVTHHFSRSRGGQHGPWWKRQSHCGSTGRRKDGRKEVGYQKGNGTLRLARASSRLISPSHLASPLSGGDKQCTSRVPSSREKERRRRREESRATERSA